MTPFRRAVLRANTVSVLGAGVVAVLALVAGGFVSWDKDLMVSLAGIPFAVCVLTSIVTFEIAKGFEDQDRQHGRVREWAQWVASEWGGSNPSAVQAAAEAAVLAEDRRRAKRAVIEARQAFDRELSKPTR